MTVEVSTQLREEAMSKIHPLVAPLLGDVDTTLKTARKGIVFMYDHSEIMDSDTKDIFTEDHDFFHAMYEFFFNDYIASLADDEYAEPEDYDSSDKLVDGFFDYVNTTSYIFYRLKDPKVTTLEEAAKVAKEASYWMPIGIFIDGEFHPTRHLGDAIYF